MENEKMPSYSDLPGIIRSHPLGLIVAILIFGVLLIYGGTIKCAFLSVFLTLLNKNSLTCNSETLFGVRVGEWIINLFQYEWFIWGCIILGFILFIYFKARQK